MNDIPSVRVMMICKADEDGIIFNTKRYKPSYSELINNPNIEMCFYNSAEDLQIRIFGVVEIDENESLKHEIVETYPKLEGLVEREGLDAIIPFRLKNWDFKIGMRH